MGFSNSWLGAKRFRTPLILAGALALASCGGEPIVEEEPAPRPAKLYTVEAASSEDAGSFPAVVRSVRSTDMAFQVSGQIIEWNAVDGAQFNRGDVIARLDATSFEAAVQEAEAQYLNADSEYKRAQRLISEDAISQSVLESREAQRQVAQAGLETAQKNLKDTVLRAPFTGGVGVTYVEEFQNVGAQQAVLVLQSSAVEAIVNVPASFVLTSNQRQPKNIFVELDANPGQQFPATFREARGVADSSTQTFEAHFSFTPPSQLLVLTGMTATLFFETDVLVDGKLPEGVEVPLASLMVEGEQQYVWVAKGPEKALERRDVTTNDKVGDMVIVTEGLSAGEIVVASGGDYLRAGEKVRAWTD